MSILEAFLAGKEARRTADAAEQINAMQQFIGQNGTAIMGGDANALGQLAGFGQQGLQMAMGIQGDTQARERQAAADAAAAEERAYGRSRDEAADGRADQEWQMQLEEYAAGKTAAERAAEAAKIEEGVKGALMTDSPEAWDAFVTQSGMPDLVGRFDQKDSIAAQFMSMADVLKANAPPSEADALALEGQRLSVEEQQLKVDALKAPPKVKFSDVSDMRKEWIGMPAVKTFQTQSDSFGRIVAASTAPSGAGDVALIYSYMKMLDPGSVVREGEFATAENTGGLDQKVVSIYNKLLSGERLTPEMRADFVGRATGIYGNAEAEYDALRNQYAGIAERNGFPVDDALPDFRYSGARPGSEVPPAGVDPADWAEMTPDERAAFK